jgi:alpha-beta hydrolase superfamily lysophospholipase
MFFVTTISKEYSNLPIFVLAQGMGGFIATNAMCRLPSLIQRSILLAPMIRQKCGMKFFNFRYPFPQTVAYWIAAMHKHLGMGTLHYWGYLIEKSTDKLPVDIYTSDQEQLEKWMDLRMRYPNLITTCITNDWFYHSIRAQNKFESKYEFVKTNTLILRFHSFLSF